MSLDGSFQVSFYQGKSEIRAAYSELLESLPWDYYLTQTYRHLHRDTISAPARHWEALQDAGATRAYIAVEPHFLDGLHLHTLAKFHGRMADATLFHRLDLRRDLRRDFGFADVQRIRDPGQVASYCSKYVTKGSLSYELLGDAASWDATRPSNGTSAQYPLL